MMSVARGSLRLVPIFYYVVDFTNVIVARFLNWPILPLPARGVARS